MKQLKVTAICVGAMLIKKSIDGDITYRDTMILGDYNLELLTQRKLAIGALNCYTIRTVEGGDVK